MLDERRQHQRYTSPDEALAVLKPHPIKLGQVVNISEGGLAFQYLSNDKIDTKHIELDIFISADGPQYTDIPFTAVKDFRVSSRFDESIPKRQLCIKFNGLSNEQKRLIKNLICLHAA